MSLRTTAALALRAAQYKLRPQPPYTVTTDLGEMRIAHVDEYSQRWLYRSADNLNHWHEPSLSWLLLLAGIRGATGLLDIGAHLGYFSMLHTQRPGTTAHALELDPKNFEILQRMVARNGTRNVHVFNRGAAAAPGQIAMPTAQRPSPRVSLGEGGGASGNTRNVPLVTVDDFVAEQDIAPDIIKIDVEGAEFGVIRGASGLLAARRPLVAVEIHPSPMQKMDAVTPDDFASEMAGHGYAAFRFEDSRDSECSPLRPFKGWDGAPRDFDLIFVATESAAPLVEAYNAALPILAEGRFPAPAAPASA